MFVDVHAHLDDKQFQKDLPEVIERAKAAGVTTIINNGSDMESNRKTLELSKKFSIIRPALGFYPGFAQNLTLQEIDREIEFIRKSKPIAIGEVGLDFYHEHNKNKQTEIFQKFITLAEKLKLPLIVHSRKAEKEVVDLLLSSKLKKVILHCYTGKLKIARIAEDNGFSFSIPPIVINSKQFQQLVEQTSISNLLTETDSPYLSAIKSERNEPKNVVDTVKKIAEIKNLDKLETKNLIFMNFQRIF
jgi:TatD DNase family protein